MAPPAHEHACACPAHQGTPADARGGLWAAIAPALACALCPACVSAYAKVLSVLGVGVVISEAQHALVLGVAVGFSVLVSAWRTWRTGRVWPIAIALGGCSLILAGHGLGDVEWLEWAGVGTLLVGGLAEHRAARRAHARSPAPAG